LPACFFPHCAQQHGCLAFHPVFVNEEMPLSALDRFFYPDYDNHWDDALLRGCILRHLAPDSVVLDLGAGSGAVQEMHFRGLCKQVCGLDPSQEVLCNPHLEVARVGAGEFIPWPDATFDLVYANNVLEHLENPLAVFDDVRRVLKPGGMLIVKTPNYWHYVPILARLTPLRFHRFVNKVRGRPANQTFPKFYRANTKERIVALASQSGFDVTSFDYVEGRPEYLRGSPLYLLGLAWERFVNCSSALEFLRVIIIASLMSR
jgi:SAM-dependent methyltransferase